VRLAFDPQVVRPADLIARLTQRHSVVDLFVENPPIEALIARFYEDLGRGA
jgi:ABC-2 type transport system ATP-binding protein